MHESGQLFSYPAPLSVYPYHHALFPAPVRDKLRARKLQNRILGPLGRFPLTGALGRAAQRKLVARGGSLGVAAEMVRANFQLVHSTEIVPADRLIDNTQVKLGLYLSRGGVKWSVDDVGLDTARSLYLATTYEELGLNRSLALYSINRVVDLPRHWQRASHVSERFLGSADQLLTIAVPSSAQPYEVQKFVLQTIVDRLG